MEQLKERCQKVFPKSRKLKNVQTSDGQLENVVARLHQIFTKNELTTMDEKTLIRQVERVWPIAKYIDKK
jgi:hypothetical protein